MRKSIVPAVREADTEFREAFLSLVPALHAFSRCLCRDAYLAADISQAALCKAWQARASFLSGSNLRAWMFKILRNEFYAHRRTASRSVALSDEQAERLAGPENPQEWSVRLAETMHALRALPSEQQTALMLIADGYDYEEAAGICDCPAGTVKSRVARARMSLRKAL